MKRFVMGDIHGQYDKLKSVLKKSNFDYDKDFLIQLGDIVDRGPEPIKCFEELFKIRNLISIRGNHDEIFMTWIKTGIDYFGGAHGVKETHQDWKSCSNKELKLKILKFLNNQQNYYIDEDDNLFVHGGIDRWETIENQNSNNFYWDRKMIESALSASSDKKSTLMFIDDFNKVYIGHTPTLTFKSPKTKKYSNEPQFLGNKIWALDTGAPFDEGKLTIMNIETEEYFQA